MPTKSSRTKERIEHHKDGSIWAKGNTLNGKLHGYWEWFRKDGTKLRSGYFNKGEQTGEWTICDKDGEVYQVPAVKPKPKKTG